MPDQLVIAGERPGLDLELGSGSAAAAQLVEQRLVGGVGEGQALGEGATVGGDQLAGVDRDRGQPAPADPDLDPTPGRPGVERVVVGVETQVGLLGDPGDEAAVGLGHGRR